MVDGRSERVVRPRACTVCTHARRAELETQRVAGVPYRTLAKTFDVGKDAVARHFAHHVTDKRKAELMAGPAMVDDLIKAATKESRSAFDFLRVTHGVLFNQFITAAEASDRQGVIDTSKPLLDALRTVARVTGELQSLAGISITNNHNTINFTASPAFAELSSGLLEISRQFPEAKSAIIGLLRRLDDPERTAAMPPNGKAVLGLPMGRGAPVVECEAVEMLQ